MNIPFKQVDVFTRVRFKGNPVAVVLDGNGLTVGQMHQIANWTNLSETTFVVPTTDLKADYRVRIFTPNSEIPFAGHPTIGTAHALLEAGMVQAHNGSLVQQCGTGLVGLHVEHDANGEQWISFDMPRATFTELEPTSVEELEATLGVEVLRHYTPSVVHAGTHWVVAQLPSAADVLSCRPDLQRMSLMDAAPRPTGVIIFGEYPDGAPARIEVRAFAPAEGVDEDPVCGSGNGSVGAFIRHTGQTTQFGGNFLSSQGAVLGRAGILRLSVSEGHVRVGGMAVTCVDGELLV